MRANRRGIIFAALGVGAAVLSMWMGYKIATRRVPEPLSSSKPAPRSTDSPSTTPARITIDYPAEGAVFPPEFPAPTWEWRDGNESVTSWSIEITFTDGASPIRVKSDGEPPTLGKSDPRCVSSTNKPPALTPEQASTHTWTPNAAVWSALKTHSLERPAKMVITGHRHDNEETILSRGEVSIQTSRDEVGAPIFYRDVPLMPSENEKGVIKPLAPTAVPLIGWRLRNVGDTESRLLMDGLHTCANCHSFSADGKTLGMDMDGPLNDKGLYAMVDIKPQTTIRNEDLIAWSDYRGKLGSRLRVGFMSRISPDARYVVTTVNDPGVDQTDYRRGKNPLDLIRNYYVANFKDYRFLQVFFPTRGVLAWYSRESKRLNYLPGADDPKYVHANAVWSPDGKYLVFARAEAGDAYPENAPVATFAGDPNERQIRYDLYRIPFNGGKGGTAEPIVGASDNGMSNSFPKISPDGRFIVFVQSKNGLLMRPDSQLYIVPTAGGAARRMTCNTTRMNSWHSFSPNGRWMVFSSKSRSPYTQMFLTHLDEAGNDSPPILVEKATAANRAVNLPEFVNIPPDGLVHIDTPAAEYAKHTDSAVELMKKQQYARAVPEWEAALALSPNQWRAHNSLGVALMELGRADEALGHYRTAIALNSEYAEAYNNLGEAAAGRGAVDEAITYFSRAAELDGQYATAHTNLGKLLARTGREKEAIPYLKTVTTLSPDSADAHRNLGHALAETGDLTAAMTSLQEAVRLSDGKDALALHLLSRVYENSGNLREAVKWDRLAFEAAMRQNNGRLAQTINAHLMQLVR